MSFSMKRLAVAIALAAVAACKSQDPAPSRIIVFDDIPVPIDFALVQEKSDALQHTAFRSGKLVYEGKARQEILIQWYKKSMPSLRWFAVPSPSDETGAGPYTLRFEKGVERCEIQIESPKDITCVTVTLGCK
jgi:hypothetical protein